MLSNKQPIWTKSFISVFIATLLVFTAFYLLLPTLPLYLINHLKVNSSSAGIALAAYTVAALIIRPVTGFMIDLHGRKWIYLGSLLVFSLIFGGYILAASLAGMILLRMAHGLLWGIVTTTGNTLAVDLVPAARRGEGLGYFGLSSTIPMAIGPLIGLKLVSHGNYDRMFIIAVLISAVGFAFASGIRIPKIPLQKVSFSLINLFERSALPVSLTLLISMISYGGVVSFISLYVKTTGIGDAGMFFLIFACGIALARLFSGKVFDRQGPLMLSIGALLLLAFGYLLLAYSNSNAGFLASSFSLGLGSGIVFPTFHTMANNMVQPQRRGAANSTLFTALDLGIGTGMVLTGFLAGTIGLGNTFLIFSLLNILALLLFLFLTFNHYQRHKIG